MASQEITNEGVAIRPYFCKPRAARSVSTPLGSKWKISAKLSVDPVSGEKIAEPGEKTDLNAYIQASKSSTDIVTIISKLRAGDESVINVRQGFYGDSTIIPKDINDIVAIEKMNATAKANYDKLPDEVKALFGSDAEFLSAVLDGSANTKINAYVVAAEEAARKAAEAAESIKNNESEVTK